MLSYVNSIPSNNLKSNKDIMNKFSKVEFAILTMTIIIIFISEYYYIVLKDHDRAIFIGLWPPTMLMLLMYLNSKKQK